MKGSVGLEVDMVGDKRQAAPGLRHVTLEGSAICYVGRVCDRLRWKCLRHVTLGRSAIHYVGRVCDT